MLLVLLRWKFFSGENDPFHTKMIKQKQFLPLSVLIYSGICEKMSIRIITSIPVSLYTERERDRRCISVYV